jgi:hypothetical protein
MDLGTKMAGTSPATDTTYGVTKLYGQNQYYLVIISSSVHGTVQAWLPQDIALEIVSSWGFIVGGGEEGNAGINWLSTISVGVVPRGQYLSSQEWRGGGPLDLILPLHFFATEDSNREVIKPIKTLIKMSLPRKSDPNAAPGIAFQLVPPGPRQSPGPIFSFIGGVFKEIIGPFLPNQVSTEPDIINVYVGNFLRLPGVFVLSVQPTFSGRLSAETAASPAGLPMQGTCAVKFRTLMAPVASDMDAYLLSGLNDRSSVGITGGG